MVDRVLLYVNSGVAIYCLVKASQGEIGYMVSFFILLTAIALLRHGGAKF